MLPTRCLIECCACCRSRRGTICSFILKFETLQLSPHATAIIRIIDALHYQIVAHVVVGRQSEGNVACRWRWRCWCTQNLNSHNAQCRSWKFDDRVTTEFLSIFDFRQNLRIFLSFLTPRRHVPACFRIAIWRRLHRSDECLRWVDDLCDARTTK